jgi:aminoglycoside 3-N-acetyltransferase
MDLRTTDLVQQLRDFGVREDGVLLVHTSFRACQGRGGRGAVEGGPLGLIRALRAALGPKGTLVMPTMTDGESVFDPASTPTTDMGIVAETFWRQPGVRRSTHPGASFAAEGPHAERICQPQPLSPPHGPDSPVGRVHDLDGQILLLGVRHSENTTIHLAEAIAKVPYSVEHPCVVEIDGVARTLMIAETDHCCEKFVLADAWLRERGLQREGKIGNADARLCNARDVVSVVTEHLAREPLAFLCTPGNGCEQCDAARASIDRT